MLHISSFVWLLLGCAHAETSAPNGVWLFSDHQGHGRAYFAPQVYLPFDICHRSGMEPPHDRAKYFKNNVSQGQRTQSAMTLWDPSRGSQVHSARVVGGCAGLYRAHCFKCWDYGEDKKKQMFLGEFCESSGIVNTGDGYGGLHHIGYFKASTETKLLSTEALQGWRIRVSANTTQSGWAWDVAELQFHTDSGALIGCSPIHSGSVSDKENGGIPGYEPECALTERRCRWGGRKDKAGMFWLGLQCKEQHVVTKVVINQPSGTHYAAKVIVEISEAGGQPWKAVGIPHNAQVGSSIISLVASTSSLMVPTTAVMTTTPTPFTYGGSVRIKALGATQTQMELVTQKALASEFGVSASAVVIAAVGSRRLAAATATATKSGNWVVSFIVTFSSVKASPPAEVRSKVLSMKANTATLSLKIKTELKAAGAAASVYDAIEVSSFAATRADGMVAYASKIAAEVAKSSAAPYVQKVAKITAAPYVQKVAKSTAAPYVQEVAKSTAAPYGQQKQGHRGIRPGVSGISGARSMCVTSAVAVIAFAIRVEAR